MFAFLLALLVLTVSASNFCRNQCSCRNDLPSLAGQGFSDYPQYVVFTQKSKCAELYDNECHTYFKQSEDSKTYKLFFSMVKYNGLTKGTPVLGTKAEDGVSSFAALDCTFRDRAIGKACNITIIYRCHLHGGCWGNTDDTTVFGLSPEYKRLNPSCLHEIEDILKENKIPPVELYCLPMKRSPRCVYSNCSNAPNYY